MRPPIPNENRSDPTENERAPRRTNETAHGRRYEQVLVSSFLLGEMRSLVRAGQTPLWASLPFQLSL